MISIDSVILSDDKRKTAGYTEPVVDIKFFENLHRRKSLFSVLEQIF
jgi:hypothetical protein